MNTRNAIIVSLLLTGAAALYGLMLYPSLPEMVPCHWNIRGEVDGWMPKGTAVVFSPGIMLAMLALLGLAPALSPKPFSVESFRATFNAICVQVIGLMGFIHWVMLHAALTPDMDSGRTLIGGLMVFLALMANLLGRVRRNLWMGVRTPWTLASDRVWNGTHRFAARLWSAVGLACALLVFLGAPLPEVFTGFMVAMFAPVAYSYWLYRQLGPDDASEGAGPVE